MFSTVISAIITIVVVTVVLVALLLYVKIKLTPDGTVKIDINDGKKVLDVPQGSDLLHTLADQKIFLPSACGGKANCGQCKVQVLEGGGTILPTETGFFSRKQIKDGYRLGCQVKVKENIKIQVPESTLSVQKLECEVISNKNVATFIKEFTVKLPEGVHLDFKSGEYIQIDIPAYDLDFSTIDVDDIYKADWEKYGFFGIKTKNEVPTIRAYSMASYPAEGDIIKLNVRIATPPFDRSQPKGVFKMLPVPPGVGSSYVFTRKPGDKVWISGPFGEFLLPKMILILRNISSWVVAPAWLLSEATSCICSRPSRPGRRFISSTVPAVLSRRSTLRTLPRSRRTSRTSTSIWLLTVLIRQLTPLESSTRQVSFTM